MRGAVEGRADWLAGRLSDQLENVVRSLLPLISKRLMGLPRPRPIKREPMSQAAQRS
jgi:hypothetical protein